MAVFFVLCNKEFLKNNKNKNINNHICSQHSNRKQVEQSYYNHRWTLLQHCKGANARVSDDAVILYHLVIQAKWECGLQRGLAWDGDNGKLSLNQAPHPAGFVRLVSLGMLEELGPEWHRSSKWFGNLQYPVIAWIWSLGWQGDCYCKSVLH